jgi:carbonic anhydrase
MTGIDDLLAANRAHVAVGPRTTDPRPRRGMVVITCMDARIDLAAAFGIQPDDAQVLRNAGARVTEDVLRSLAVSCSVLGVATIVIVHHTGCLISTYGEEELRRRTGATLLFRAFDDHAEAARADIALLADAAYLASVTSIVSVLYDVDTGAATELATWQR